MAEISTDRSTMLEYDMIAQLPLAMAIVDVEGRLLWLSPDLETLAGQGHVGEFCWVVCMDDGLQTPDCPLRHSIEVGTTVTREKDGMLGARTFLISHSRINFKGTEGVLMLFQESGSPEDRSRPRIRVGIVDLDELRRAGFDSLLSQEDGFADAGSYGNGKSAIAGIPDDLPDVLLVNCGKAGEAEGGDSTWVFRLLAKFPELPLVLLGGTEDDETILRALRAGANGALLKSARPELIFAAITAAHAGNTYLCGAVAAMATGSMGPRRGEVPADMGKELDVLTPREREVLAGLASGLLYKEIATELQISIDTVRGHLKRIYSKLRVSSRTEAVVKFLGA